MDPEDLIIEHLDESIRRLEAAMDVFLKTDRRGHPYYGWLLGLTSSVNELKSQVLSEGLVSPEGEDAER